MPLQSLTCASIEALSPEDTFWTASTRFQGCPLKTFAVGKPPIGSDWYKKFSLRSSQELYGYFRSPGRGPNLLRPAQKFARSSKAYTSIQADS